MDRVMLVASTGGHLAELHHFRNEVSETGDDVSWVTFASEQTWSLLAGERVLVLPAVRPRGYLALLRLLPKAARLMWIERPTRIVSTGSGVALAFLPLAPLIGAEAVYIESAARISGPSVTGLLLSRLPWVRTYTQYPASVSRRWAFKWSVFDRWRSLPAPTPRPAGQPPRVLVTLGTMKFPFPRLVDAVVRAAPPDTTFVWQLGETVPRRSLPGRSFSLMSTAELERHAHEATMIVSHAGVGSALLALKCGVRPILVPRTKAHGEHVDDHQVEVARDLQAKGLATCVAVGDLTPDLFDLNYRIDASGASDSHPH